MPRGKSKDNASASETLRTRAEKRLSATEAEIAGMPGGDIRRLIQELQVHQIELELQNEELRNSQVELAESRDRFSDLYEFAPVGYVTLKKDGRILEGNLTAAVMLGVERRAVPGTNVSKFVTRKSQDDWHRHRQAVFSGGTKQTCEIDMRKADGTPFAARLESRPFGPESDRRILMAIVDVTARKRAEESLREITESLERRVQEQTSRIRLQAKAIANLGEGVLITSDRTEWPDTHIVFVNEALCRITGYAAEDLIGRTARALHGPRTARETVKRIQEELQAGNSCREEVVNYRKNGTPYYAEILVTPLMDEQGHRTNFVSIHRDVTARRKADVDLDNYRKDLRALTSELMSVEERERQRLAQDLHDSLSQAIFLARRKLDKRAHEEVGAILDSIARTVNTMTFELSPPVLRQLGLRSATKWLGGHMKERFGLSVRVVDDGKPPARLDDSLALVLFRSMRELLINVVKHAGTSSATVRERRRGSRLEIQIEDKGKGFDTARHSRPAKSGCFGLFSVRERLEYLGGSLKIQSAPGKGTIVTMSVPTPVVTPDGEA